MSSSWPLGVLIQKNSTKITTSYGLHSPNTWHELGFTIIRAQIRTYIAKMGGYCISSTSEISKCRRTWPLAIRCIETHSDRPRCLWGIGGRLGHPSKFQSRPCTYRNHITASQTAFHTQIHGHVGEIPPSFDGIAQKQNTHGQGEGRDGFGMGGGVLL
jgi:hypothetical protein